MDFCLPLKGDLKGKAKVHEIGQFLPLSVDMEQKKPGFSFLFLFWWWWCGWGGIKGSRRIFFFLFAIMFITLLFGNPQTTKISFVIIALLKGSPFVVLNQGFLHLHS